VECSFPPELDDKKLWTFVDGEADDDTKYHLERCEYCTSKAQELVRQRDNVGLRVFRVYCPPSLELGEYYLHFLPPNQSLVVAQHVRGCKHCQQELARLNDFFRATAVETSDGLLNQVKILTAKMISDIAPALRGERKGPIIVEVEGIVITLDVQPATDGQVSILGQVAAESQDDWTDAQVEMKYEGTAPQTTTVDDLGSFKFETIPGTIQITIKSTQGIIVQTQDIDIIN